MFKTSSWCSILLYSGQNGRCINIIQKNVQIFGYVYQSTHGQNHGPIWKTQSFFSKGICTVILWQDYCGKGNLRKSYSCTVGRKFPIGMFVCKPRKRTLLVSVWTTNGMLRRPSFQRRRIEIRGRIMSMVSNFLEMMIFGTNWTTRYSMVSEQTCKINREMDQSSWQTLESIDILRPSCMWT